MELDLKRTEARTLVPRGTLCRGGTEGCVCPEFGPEKGFDPAAKFRSGTQYLTWTPQPDWKDGVVVTLPEDLGATYLRRILTADSAGPCRSTSAAATMPLRVWLNGRNSSQGCQPRGRRQPGRGKGRASRRGE